MIKNPKYHTQETAFDEKNRRPTGSSPQNRGETAPLRPVLPRRPLLGALLAVMVATAPAQMGCTSTKFTSPAATRAADLQSQLLKIAKLEDARQTDPAQYAPYLIDARPEIRARAALAMGRTQSADFAGHLRALLKDENPEVRGAAIFALGQFPERIVEGDLIAQYEGESTLKWDIVKALGKVGGEDSVSILLAAMQSGDSALQSEAALAIGIQGYRNRWPDGILPPLAAQLFTALQAEDESLRVAATYALIRAPLGEGQKSDAAEALTAALSDSSPAVRGNAARALAKLDGAVRSEIFAPLLQDENWQVRVNALRAIGKVGGNQAAFLVKDSLQDPSLQVQEQAIRALTQIGDRAAIEWLHPFLNSDYLSVQVPTLEALAKLDGDNQSELLVAKAASRDAMVRSAAVGALGEISGEAITTQLVALANQEQDPRVMVTHALVFSSRDDGVDTEETLIDFLRRGDGATVSVSAEILAEKKSETALPHLLEAYKRQSSGRDYEAQVAIIQSIATLGGPEILIGPLLEEALDDPDQRVALAAAEATQSLYGKTIAVPTAPPRFPATAGEYEGISERTRVFINTSKGQIVLRLRPDKAPLTVLNFTRLARNGFYDGLVWHRVVPDFVAQTGSPRGDGWGGPGYTIRCEINELPYERGVVGMALSGKDTGGSQWFITHSPQPHLDGGYTVFASVESGMNVVDNLTRGDQILNIRFGDEIEKLDTGRPVGL